MKKRAVVPVVEETVAVGKRTVDRGGVRLSKTVRSREQTIDVPLVHEEVEVERIPKDVWLDAPAKVRREGDVLVVPVMEEVLVTETKLRLREEIVIRRRKVRRKVAKKVTVRREEVSVERLPPGTRRR